MINITSNKSHFFFFFFLVWGRCSESSPLDGRTCVCQPRHQALVNSLENADSIWMVVDGAECYRVLSCLLLAPNSQAAVGAITHLCIVERDSPTPVRRRLRRTNANLGKNIFDGAVLTFAMNEWSQEMFSHHPTFHL